MGGKMSDNPTVICPACGNGGNKVLYRLHWSKGHHEFICGHCRVEFPLIHNIAVPLNNQLKLAWKEYFQFDHEDAIQTIKNKVDNMTDEEKEERLKELNAKKKEKK